MSHIGAIAQRVGRPLLAPTRWNMWSAARPRWLVYMLACEAAAAVLMISDLLLHPGTRSDLQWTAVLLVLGIGQGEMSRHIERVRRWMAGQTHINVTSVWYVAG